MPEAGNPVPASVQVWRALQRIHADMYPVLDAELRQRTGLPSSWYDMLVELTETQRLRMSDLGARMVLSRTRVSRLVADLEADGLVVREDNPGDRRSAYVALTAAGRQRLAEATPHHWSAVDERFAGLADDELAALTRALQKVLADAHHPHPQD